MAMSFDLIPRPKSKVSRLPWPMIAQVLSVIFGIICIAIVVPIIYSDGARNQRLDELKEKFSKETAGENGRSRVSPDEIKELLRRDSWMEKVFCLVIAFGVVVTLEHIFIYLIYTKESYRYNFTIAMNFFLAFVYTFAALFLLISTLQNDSNYGEMYKLLHKRNVSFSPNVTLHYYRFCQVNVGTRTEDQLPPPPPDVHEKLSRTQCQKYYYKMAGVALALINFLFFSIVILTVKSTRREIKKLVENAKDLDVESWMWNHPNGDQEFLKKYIHEQERAKYALREIEVEPDLVQPPQKTDIPKTTPAVTPKHSKHTIKRSRPATSAHSQH